MQKATELHTVPIDDHCQHEQRAVQQEITSHFQRKHCCALHG